MSLAPVRVEILWTPKVGVGRIDEPLRTAATPLRTLSGGLQFADQILGGAAPRDRVVRHEAEGLLEDLARELTGLEYYESLVRSVVFAIEDGGYT